MTRRRARWDIRNHSRQIFLFLLVLFGLNFAAYALYVRPRAVEYDRLRVVWGPRFEELSQREEEVGKREQFLQAVKQAQLDLKTLRNEVLATRSERMVEVHLEVVKLARQFKVDPDRVTINNELLVGEELDRMEMIVPLEGGYSSLRRFLQAIEESDKFLVVEQVALAKGKQGGVLLQLNITIATYFKAPQDLLDRERARRGRGSRS